MAEHMAAQYKPLLWKQGPIKVPQALPKQPRGTDPPDAR